MQSVQDSTARAIVDDRPRLSVTKARKSAPVPGTDQHAATVIQPWLLPHPAAAYLGVTLDDLLPLVETGQLPLHRAPDQGLRFHRDDLDAVQLVVPPTEAARLLAVEVSLTTKHEMTNTKPTSSAVPESSTYMPLKDAAKQLNQPYKAMLRLVHSGKIPASNQGTSTRPRFMVDVDAILRLWADEAQREMRKRAAPALSLDFTRLLSPSGKGGKGAHHG